MIRCIMPSGDHMIPKGLCMEINLFQRKTMILADTRLGEHNCYLQIYQLAVECNQILHVNSDSSDLQYSGHFYSFHEIESPNHPNIGRTSYDVQFIIVLSI